jgi:hypothetical protein
MTIQESRPPVQKFGTSPGVKEYRQRPLREQREDGPSSVSKHSVLYLGTQFGYLGTSTLIAAW